MQSKLSAFEFADNVISGTKLPSIESNRKDMDKSKILEILDNEVPSPHHSQNHEKDGSFKFELKVFTVKSDDEINPMKRELAQQPSMPLKTVEGLHDS